jgi:hypothetical protein
MQDVCTAGNGRAFMDEMRLTTPAAMAEAATARAQKIVAAGGILAAVAASSCCIVPLLLFSLGVSGAWIGNLTAIIQPARLRAEKMQFERDVAVGLSPHGRVPASPVVDQRCDLHLFVG